MSTRVRKNSAARCVRLALLGCGRIAQAVHLPVLRTLPIFKVVALAEPDEALRCKASRQFSQATPHTDWRQVLAWPNVDAVLIALPNALHAECAIAAFENKKHVYLEKPLALDLESAERVLAAWKSSGCIGAIGFNYRFHPLLQALKGELQNERVGKVIAVRTCFSSASQAPPAWKATRAQGGGVLLDLASHHIDALRFLFEQNIEKVSARVFSIHREADNAMLQLELQNGVAVQSFFSWTSANEDRWEIFGTKGKIGFERFSSLALESSSVRLAEKIRTLAKTPYGARGALRKIRFPTFEPSYRLVLQRFGECILHGENFSPDIRDGIESLKTILRAENFAERLEHDSAPE